MQVFRSIACILIIVSLPFLSLMDNLVIVCKGVGHSRELGKSTVVELIHWFIAGSKDCLLCEVLWWSWLRIGDTWVSCMEKTL